MAGDLVMGEGKKVYSIEQVYNIGVYQRNSYIVLSIDCRSLDRGRLTNRGENK